MIAVRSLVFIQSIFIGLLLGLPGLGLAQEPVPLEQVDQWQQEMVELHAEGNYSEALVLAQKILDAKSLHYEEDSEQIAVSLAWFGFLHKALGNYEEAEPLYARALAIREEQLGPDHPDTATSLNNLALLYKSLGRSEEAEPLLARARAILEEQLGPDHPTTALSLNNLADLYQSLGRSEEAEPLYARALAILEEQLGADHPHTAISLNNLADLYESMGRYGKAEPLYARDLAISEEQLGPDHPDTATSLNNLADLYESMGRSEEAEPLYARALTIREEQLGPNHPDTVLSLNNLALLYRALGRYEEAEPLYTRALAIAEEELGPDHPSTALSLNNLALLYKSLGRYEEAEPLYTRALAIQEEHLGADHPDTALSLNNLAALYLAMGRYEEAEPLYARALGIREEQLGADDPSTATSLNNLALLYQSLGRYKEAEPLSTRALAIREEQLGADHSDTATSLNNLAGLYKSLGRYEEAEPLYARALTIWEEQLGADHPYTATSLNNLALLYDSLGRYEEAEPLYARALTIWEEQLGADHPYTATSLNNLAGLYQSLGRYEEAEPLSTRALTIYEKQLGADHSDTAASLNSLAFLYKSLGRYEEAEPLYARALTIFEEQLGADHPYTGGILNNLAFLYQSLGRSEEAGQLGAKGSSIKTQNLRRVLNYFAEAECLAYAKTLYSYNLAGFLEAPALSACAQLQTKGLVMEAMGYRRRLEAELADDPQGLALLGEREQLAPTYQQLLLQEGEAAEATQKLKTRITELDKQINLRLQGASGEVLELVPPQVELEEVRAALPEGVRLLQGFRYHHRLKENLGWEPRYAWTVVGPEAVEPAFVALGSAEEIDDAIATYRAFFARRQDSRSLPQALSRLYQLLWEPLEKAGALENVNTVVISGDAQLHFLPFGTLIRQDQDKPHFLCQDYAIRFVNSGRDLVKQPRESSSEETRSALLVGNPAYNWKEMLVASVEDERLSRNLNLGLDEDTRGMFFAPLPGTKWEAELLDEMLSSSGYAVKSLSESDATESALRAAIERPDILHLATHGFFLREPEQDTLPEERRGLQVQFANATSSASPIFDLRRVQDPMLRSGLALTGAQNTIEAWQKRETPDPDNDGLLLAAEAAGLDLRGTKLVVMSACSTGEGRAMDGEGVMGLRRALAVAGAETVVMSMWPVDDAATVEFMERFYKRHLDGMHPAQALDETRRELLMERVETEGLYKAIQRYGPFIATSIGPVVPGNPRATDLPVVAKPEFTVANGTPENIGLNVILGLTLALFVLGIVQRFQRRRV